VYLPLGEPGMGCFYSRSITIDNQSTCGLKVFIEQDHRERYAKDIKREVQISGGGVGAGIASSASGYESVFNRGENGELMDLVARNNVAVIRIPGRGAYVRLLVQTVNDWEEFADIRKFMNSGDTLVVTDEMLQMLFSAFELENRTGHTIKVLDDDKKELATVVKEQTLRIRIQGQGCFCTFKVEPKDEWEKYESPREYINKDRKFILESNMVNLIEGSVFLVNKSTFQVKILLKHDDLPIDEVPDLEQKEGEDFGKVTNAVNSVRIRKFSPGHSERFIIPGVGAFCMMYVLTLGNDWKQFDDVLTPINNSQKLIVDDKWIKQVLVSINKKRTLPGGNYLFVGNPGVGKSTLASSLCGKTLFKSGPSTDGSGVTSRLETYPLRDGVTIMDTPGLSDQEKRKEAAEAIEQALSKGGFFRVFFVITMEAGRIRPDDLATIQIVLDGVKNITSFGIIMNKVSPRMIKSMTKNEETFQKWKLSIVKSLKNAPTPNIIINARSYDLEDAPCEDFEGDVDEDGHHAFTYTMADELFKFITQDVIGFLREDSTAVKLDLKSYDELAVKMGEQLAAFEQLIKSMSHDQARQIERLQKENDESVRKIQEEAAKQARELREAQEHEAMLRQKAIEDAEKKEKEEQEKFKRELEKLKKKAEEEAAAGLEEKDSQWRHKIEEMRKQNMKEVRIREKALAALKKKKQQEEKEYKKKLAQQQKKFNEKLKEKSTENQTSVQSVVNVISDQWGKFVGRGGGKSDKTERKSEKTYSSNAKFANRNQGRSTNQKNKYGKATKAPSPKKKYGTATITRAGGRKGSGISKSTPASKETNSSITSDTAEAGAMRVNKTTETSIKNTNASTRFGTSTVENTTNNSAETNI